MKTTKEKVKRKLKHMLKQFDYELVQGTLDVTVNSIAYHSGKVKEGGVFVAIKGFLSDGHDYIDDAIKRGAKIIFIQENLQDDLMEKVDTDIIVIQVKNTRKILAHLSNEFYGRPSEKMKVIGITGTNGKTTTSYFLHSIHRENKERVSTIGTTGIIENDLRKETNFTTTTTPESLELQKVLNDFTREKNKRTILEVSSHSLELDRVYGVDFETAMFLNLSPDHLELHKDMESYFLAKEKLFQLTRRFNIINVDDFYGKKLVDICKSSKAKTITIGIDNEADFTAQDIKYDLSGTSYTLKTPTYKIKIKLSLPGKYNVYNSLIAAAEAYLEEVPKDVIQKGIKNVKNVPGRFNVVYEKEHYKVIIDFAHTEDALRKFLETVKPFVKGRLILVFGVYADMSKHGKEKRVNMGKVAGELADLSIVTLDNPKFNNTKIILRQTIDGVKQKNGKYITIKDREKAIIHALSISKKDDIVVISGKGHELTQNINGKEIYFNEKEIVLNALKERNEE